MRTPITFAFLFLFSLSCNISQQDSGKKRFAQVFKGYDLKGHIDPQLLPASPDSTTNIPVNVKPSHGLDINTLLESVRYLKLATGSQCLIGNIDRIFCHKDRIVIIDRQKAKAVFIFDQQGNFLNKIQHIGRGPGEYIEITDAALNTLTEEITILDLRNRRLLFYDLNGKFVRDQPVYFQFMELAWLPNGNAVLLNYSLANYHMDSIANYNLFVVDKDFNLLYKSVPFDYRKDDRFRTFGKNHLLNINDDVYFTPRYKDSIIAIRPGSSSGKYFLDFGSQKLPPSFWANPDDLQFNSFLEVGNREIFSGVFSATPRAAFFQIMCYGSYHYVFYFTKSHKMFSCNYFTGESREALMLPAPVISYKNEFISIIKPAEIKALLKNDRVSELMKNKSQQFKDMVASLNETDNPVLMFFSVKDVQ